MPLGVQRGKEKAGGAVAVPVSRRYDRVQAARHSPYLRKIGAIAT